MCFVCGAKVTTSISASLNISRIGGFELHDCMSRGINLRHYSLQSHFLHSVMDGRRTTNESLLSDVWSIQQLNLVKYQEKVKIALNAFFVELEMELNNWVKCEAMCSDSWIKRVVWTRFDSFFESRLFISRMSKDTARWNWNSMWRLIHAEWQFFWKMILFFWVFRKVSSVPFSSKNKHPILSSDCRSNTHTFSKMLLMAWLFYFFVKRN